MFKSLFSSLTSAFKSTPVIHYCNLCNEAFEGSSALALAEICEEGHFQDLKDPLSQEDMIKLFKRHLPESKVYVKKDSVLARIAKPNEVINTTITKEFDVVVKGSNDEEYVLNYELFKKLYLVDSPLTYVYSQYNSCVKCIALQYKNVMIAFADDTGETFFVKSGDYLASPDPKISKVYTLESRYFLENYELIENS